MLNTFESITVNFNLSPSPSRGTADISSGLCLALTLSIAAANSLSIHSLIIVFQVIPQTSKLVCHLTLSTRNFELQNV